MSDQDRPGYRVDTYVRPNQPYCCGRSGTWGKSCWQGPDANGQCGGTSECNPVRVGDRWECRRPKSAGGPCEQGPLPDGTCACTQPPCTPKRTLRSLRGAVSKIAALLLLLTLIIGTDPGTPSMVNPAAIDAGRLSSVHAGFTRENGCASCHINAPHQGGGWLLSAFQSSDVSQKCGDCHRFAGPAQFAHNIDHPKNEKYAGEAMKEVSCAGCHNEHKGAENKLSKVADTACASCHKPSFDNFQKGHPQFSSKFSSFGPGNVFYDHSAHSQDYFVNPKHMKGAGRDAKFAALAKSDCTTCHTVDNKTREISLKPYEKVCSGCHQNQVVERELVLFEPERMTAAASVLFGLSRDGDEEANMKVLKNMWRAMAGEGQAAVARVAPDGLVAGLGNEEARKAGAAWSAGRDLPMADAPENGWFVGENSEGNPALFYRAVKHTDPVLQAWMKKIRAGLADKDSEKRALAREAMTEFLDKQTGPGACGKCHSAGLRAVSDGKPGNEWKYAPPLARDDAQTKYSHAQHLNVADPGAGCSSCHQLNATSTYPKYFTPKVVPVDSYQSNFAGVGKAICVECHQKGKVDASCQTCHAYHAKHEFNVGSAKKEVAKK